MPILPDLVAHRGEMTLFPENSTAALQGAIDAGAKFVEFDVQLSGDKIPVVLHDATLDRTTEDSGELWDRTARQLNDIGTRMPDAEAAFEPRSCVATLAQCVSLLNATPHMTAFVELKHESMDRFGMPLVVERVLGDLADAMFSWVLISFEYDCLQHAQRQPGVPVGWVLPEYSETARTKAEALAPQYIFCDVNKLPEGPDVFWPGPWRWALYVIDDDAEAITQCHRGAPVIETNKITEMLQTTTFRSQT